MAARATRTSARAALPLPAHPAVWKLLAMAVRNGGLKTTKVGEVTTFTDGDLDVPGRPQVIPTPATPPARSPSICPTAAC